MVPPGPEAQATAGPSYIIFAIVHELIGERERAFAIHICHRPSVRLSETFVHPTQAIEIFSDVSMLFGTTAIC